MSERGPEPGGIPPAPGFDPRRPLGVRPEPAPSGPSRPPRRWTPTLVTLGVLALAAILIVTGALVANRHDEHAQPAATASPSVAPPAATGSNAGAADTSIPFEMAGGSGTLSILRHVWTTAGDPPPSYGAYLLVEVQVSVDRGLVGYGAEQFSAFDSDSQTFNATEVVTRQPALGRGVLSAGQSTHGWVAFDIDRSRTLVMLAGRDSQPVAALKVDG